MQGRCRPGLGAAVAAVILVLSGCGGAGEGPVDEGTPEPSDTEEEPAASDGAAEESALEEEISAARDLLADEVGAEQAPELVVAEQVTWPDGALGCPQPDQIYTQALVEGYRIVFRTGGEEIAFHGAAGEAPFRCENPQPPAGT